MHGDRMGEVCILASDDRVERIEGELIDMVPVGDYGAHPTAADVLLLIEVAQTSLSYDRKVKASPLCPASRAGGLEREYRRRRGGTVPESKGRGPSGRHDCRDGGAGLMRVASVRDGVVPIASGSPGR